MTEPQSVVFDLDDTLIRGDSGARLIRQMIQRQRWRRVLALLIALPGFALMASERGRRLGVSAFLWVATVGETDASFGRYIDEFVAAHPLRIVPPAYASLQQELAAGHRVVVATGALQAIADGLVARLGLQPKPQVVGSSIRRWLGGYVAGTQANGKAKLLRLAESGFHPPFDRAWSDHPMDLPLLRATREPCFVCWHREPPAEIRQALPAVRIVFPAESSP